MNGFKTFLHWLMACKKYNKLNALTPDAHFALFKVSGQAHKGTTWAGSVPNANTQLQYSPGRKPRSIFLAKVSHFTVSILHFLFGIQTLHCKRTCTNKQTNKHTHTHTALFPKILQPQLQRTYASWSKHKNAPADMKVLTSLMACAPDEEKRCIHCMYVIS